MSPHSGHTELRVCERMKQSLSSGTTDKRRCPDSSAAFLSLAQHMELEMSSSLLGGLSWTSRPIHKELACLAGELAYSTTILGLVCPKVLGPGFSLLQQVHSPQSFTGYVASPTETKRYSFQMGNQEKLGQVIFYRCLVSTVLA